MAARLARVVTPDYSCGMIANVRTAKARLSEFARTCGGGGGNRDHLRRSAEGQAGRARYRPASARAAADALGVDRYRARRDAEGMSDAGRMRTEGFR
jgi:hypothetical protein